MFLLQLGLFCPSDQTIDGLDVQYNNDADVRGKHGSMAENSSSEQGGYNHSNRAVVVFESVHDD